MRGCLYERTPAERGYIEKRGWRRFNFVFSFSDTQRNPHHYSLSKFIVIGQVIQIDINQKGEHINNKL